MDIFVNVFVGLCICVVGMVLIAAGGWVTWRGAMLMQGLI